LYAVNEVDSYNGAKDGSVSAFSVERQGGKKTGKLTLLNVVSSGGAGPCNINFDQTGKAVLVANYGAGSAATFRVLPGGKISEAVAHEQYAGHGPNPDRQTSPHAHCATAAPGNRHVLINDLGLDKIHVYKFDPATAELKPNDPPAYEGEPDSGPRSFVFHPNGKFAYSTNELSNTVDVLAWDAAKGKLKRIQNLPTAANPADRKNTAASVVVDREGRNLYVSNRGPENSIAHFRIEPVSGELRFLERADSGGKVPRHFALDPSERWLVVAHQESSNLVVFKRDTIHGGLTNTGRSYPMDAPTCILFV
jgi:6-phosphogluconolactonase